MKPETAPCGEGRDTEERQAASGWKGAALISQGMYPRKRPRQMLIFTPARQNPSLYRGWNWAQSGMQCSWSQQALTVSISAPETAPTAGMVGETYISRSGGRAEEPLIAQVRLAGQPAVTPPPPSPTSGPTCITNLHDLPPQGPYP